MARTLQLFSITHCSSSSSPYFYHQYHSCTPPSSEQCINLRELVIPQSSNRVKTHARTRNYRAEIGGLGERLGHTWQKHLGELPCPGIFAKGPNAAKHTQLGQVTPNHVSSS